MKGQRYGLVNRLVDKRRYFTGVGQQQTGDWPGEHSLLILGLELSKHISVLTHDFFSNIHLWSEVGPVGCEFSAPARLNCLERVPFVDAQFAQRFPRQNNTDRVSDDGKF